MAQTLKQAVARLQTSISLGPLRLAVTVLFGVLVWYLSRQNLWWVAVLAIIGFELFPGPFDRAHLKDRLSEIIMGTSMALIITLLPKAISQAVAAALYVAWRIWQEQLGEAAGRSMVNLLLIQIAAFEGLFLAAAVWNWSAAVMVVLVWGAAYLPVWLTLQRRGERGAGVLAAAWALVAAQLTWVFMTWLVSYIAQSSYLIVPQPTLILSTLAYCFGSIYLAQRQGKLSRGRLAEYLFIGVILLAVVIAGTPWRGSL